MVVRLFICEFVSLLFILIIVSIISNKIEPHKNKIGIIQFSVTTVFFYIEALIHYNMGKYGTFAFTIPDFKHNIKIISHLSYACIYNINILKI